MPQDASVLRCWRPHHPEVRGSFVNWLPHPEVRASFVNWLPHPKVRGRPSSPPRPHPEVRGRSPSLEGEDARSLRMRAEPRRRGRQLLRGEGRPPKERRRAAGSEFLCLNLRNPTQGEADRLGVEDHAGGAHADQGVAQERSSPDQPVGDLDHQPIGHEPGTLGS